MAFSLSLLVRKDLLCMPAPRVLCTYCLSCPFKAVADDTLMTSGQDPLTSGNQSSLLTFAVIHFHIITLFLPSEYVSPGFPLFSDHLFPQQQHGSMIKFDCHVKSNNGIWWLFIISNISTSNFNININIQYLYFWDKITNFFSCYTTFNFFSLQCIE